MFAYLRYFERRGIYYPTKEIIITPADIGLEYEEVYFKTADGLQLHGWFIPDEKPRATVLFSHGNAGNISYRIEIIQMLKQLRLNVFIFGYRGYGKSQGRPSEKGLYLDALAAYEYLHKQRGITPEKIVLYGRSIGANVAINLASKVPAAGLIIEAGFSSAYDMGRRLFPYLPIKWIITIRYAAESDIKNVFSPKLIIHSRDDEIIPFELGKKLFAAAPEPKRFYQIQGSHNEAIFLQKEEYALEIDSFLQTYLP